MRAICIHIGEVEVGDERVVLLRHPGGGIFGVDASYIEQEAGPIHDPFDGKSVLYQESITSPGQLAEMGRTEPFGTVYRWTSEGWSAREVTGAENLKERVE